MMLIYKGEILLMIDVNTMVKDYFDNRTEEHAKHVTSTLNTLNDNMLRAEFKPVEVIYADVELFRDFKLGALFSLITTKEEIDYIFSKLDIYNARTDCNITSYFPVLNKTEEDIATAIHNNSAKVCRVAPYTFAYNYFYYKLYQIVELNKIAKSANSKITIVLNSTDVKCPVKSLMPMIKHIRDAFPNIEFGTSHYTRYEADPEFYLKLDALFLYDYISFFSNDKIIDRLSKNISFITTKIYGTPLIDSSLSYTVDEYPQVFTSTRNTLKLICDFEFIPTGVPYSNEV